MVPRLFMVAVPPFAESSSDWKKVFTGFPVVKSIDINMPAYCSSAPQAYNTPKGKMEIITQHKQEKRGEAESRGRRKWKK